MTMVSAMLGRERAALTKRTANTKDAVFVTRFFMFGPWKLTALID